jgi:hypothetical protein
MAEDKLIAAKKALDEAREKYNEAERREKEASRDEINARNRLNEAQKAFDAAVAEVKANPPWNSEWHQSTKRGAA